MIARIDRCRIGRPIILHAADIGFMIGVHIEMQFVPTILGRGLPLEGNVARPRNGNRRPGVCTVADLARSDAAVIEPRPRLLASGVDFVEAVLLDPVGIEGCIGGDIHGIRQSVARPWSQGPVASVALARLVLLRELADVQLIALLHIARFKFARALVVQIARDRPRIERRDDEIPDPAAVVRAGRAVVFVIDPLQDMVGGILERKRDVRPVRHLAADAALLHIINVEHQRIVVGLGRSLPLVSHRAWPLDGVRGPGIRAVANRARVPGYAVVFDRPFGGGC